MVFLAAGHEALEAHSMNPKLGQIWYNHFGNYHLLIVEDNVQFGMGVGYKTLKLETGTYDHALPQHFYVQCRLIG
jgi:hypothetical protein